MALPPPPEGTVWQQLVDTGAAPSADATLVSMAAAPAADKVPMAPLSQVVVGPRAGVLLLAAAQPQAEKASGAE